MLTVSMASPFSFFSLARALALAVVERTAVATFSTVSFAGGFVDGGYANKVGLALETISRTGAYESLESA